MVKLENCCMKSEQTSLRMLFREQRFTDLQKMIKRSTVLFFPHKKRSISYCFVTKKSVCDYCQEEKYSRLSLQNELSFCHRSNTEVVVISLNEARLKGAYQLMRWKATSLFDKAAVLLMGRAVSITLNKVPSSNWSNKTQVKVACQQT